MDLFNNTKSLGLGSILVVTLQKKKNDSETIQRMGSP